MKKKIFAFYDLLIYAIVSGPLLFVSCYLFFSGKINDDLQFTWDSILILLPFAIGVVIPIVGPVFLRYLKIENGSVHFHYAIFVRTTNWEKVNDNIDVRWNQDMFISEIKDVEVVKLSEEEKAEKVFYKHWFNKYLKINFHYGNPKYVYVGNYSNFQIRKIIKLLTDNKKVL